jgi:RNA polymerase sigma-70 factor (ECF subfamily)
VTATRAVAGGGHADAELVSRAREGDVRAFGTIVDKYQSKVYGILYRMTSDPEAVSDLGQEVFLKALTALDTFQFRGDASFRTWLYRIAVNVAINELRRRKRQRKVEGVSLDETVETEDGEVGRAVPDYSQVPEEVIARRETQAEVQRIVRMLSEHHRLVITLVDLEGLSYEEAAATMGCSVGTLKSRLSRARAAFKEKYERHMSYVGGHTK